jgi:hypothetical protein
MSGHLIKGIFARRSHQCMVEASARLSMCAACVSSALAITWVTGEESQYINLAWSRKKITYQARQLLFPTS